MASFIRKSYANFLCKFEIKLKLELVDYILFYAERLVNDHIQYRPLLSLVSECIMYALS